MAKIMMQILLLLASLVLVAAPNPPKNPKIVSILESVNYRKGKISNQEKSAIVGALDEVLKLLDGDGFLSKLQIPPKKVGVHPKNRYGFGVHANNVHRLGAQIVAMGWSWAACALAICVGETGRRSISSFTTELQRGTKKLGKSNPNEIEYGSLACGHSNQFLVACLDGVPTDQPTLAGPDGCISMEKVLSTDKYGHMKEALEKGMNWQIIDPRAEEIYGPALPNLVQRARQAVGQVQNEESLLELCLECNGVAAEMIEREGDIPDYDVVEEIVGQSQVKNPDDIPRACAFVQLYGGGKHGQYIKDLAKFVALCVSAQRTIESTKLSAFLKLKLETAELCPEFVMAVLKMDYDAPEKSVFGHVCKFLKEPHIAAFGNDKKAEMIEANAHLRSFHKFLEKVEFQYDDQQTLTKGIGDCTVGRIVCELPVPAKFNDLTVVQALRLTCSELIKKGSNLENPFGPPDDEDEDDGNSAPKSTPASSGAMFGLVEYDAAGRALGVDKNTLQAQGFVVGTDVIRQEGGLDCRRSIKNGELKRCF